MIGSLSKETMKITFNRIQDHLVEHFGNVHAKSNEVYTEMVEDKSQTGINRGT